MRHRGRAARRLKKSSEGPSAGAKVINVGFDVEHFARMTGLTSRALLDLLASSARGTTVFEWVRSPGGAITVHLVGNPRQDQGEERSS